MITVSAFKESDLAIAYSIFKTARINPWSYTTFCQSAMNGLSLVAKENNMVVGYILLTSVLDEFTFEDITVDVAHRNKGIGRKLMEEAFLKAAEMAQKSILLEVRYSNKKAIDLYRALGFELIGERKNYYDTAVDVSHGIETPKTDKTGPTRENAYIMKKVL
jgi:ribosomal-protein-alanine N-acetyltransferase